MEMEMGMEMGKLLELCSLIVLSWVRSFIHTCFTLVIQWTLLLYEILSHSDQCCHSKAELEAATTKILALPMNLIIVARLELV